MYYEKSAPASDAVYVEANTDRNGVPETLVTATVSLKQSLVSLLKSVELAHVILRRRAVSQGSDLAIVARVVDSLRTAVGV